MEIGVNRKTGGPVDLPTSILRNHVAMLGGTGSGKTVAAKILIEEATLEGIPSIIVDPQGDLARMAQPADPDVISEMGGNLERLQEWKNKAEIRIWTPGKNKGIQVCVNPFTPPRGEYKEEGDIVQAWDVMASGFAALAGYNVEKSRGRQVKAFLNELLQESAKNNYFPNGFDSLADLVRNPKKLLQDGDDESVIDEIMILITKSVREELSRTLNSYNSGVTKIIYTKGVPLEVETLIQPVEEGKVPVNIFYLNSLGTEENRQTFMLELSRKINSWMLKQGAQPEEVKLLLLIDEIQKYLPPDNKPKPPPKDMLKLLFEQGRKYGVGCILATQSVSNVDYKALGQSHTMFFGKFQKPQDINKIEHLLKSSEDHDSKLVDDLPKLSAGEFQVSLQKEVSPDPIPIKTRWIYTEHGKTVTEEELDDLVPAHIREWANEKSLNHNDDDSPFALPAIDSKTATRFSSAPGPEPFESHLMGGLMLLKDPKDPLSVMLGATNLLTAVVLLATTFILGQSWIDGENSGWLMLIGSLLSLVACVALVIETLLSDEKALVQRIRKRARPIQYLILIWIWVLWFGNKADWFDLSSVSILVDMAQTATTLFVFLEMSHRLRLGRIQMQLDWNPLGMMKEAYHSLKLMISESEIEVMRATSGQVMKSLQTLTEIFTVIILGLVIFNIGPSVESVLFNEIAIRLFSIYVLQIAARGYVYSQKNA